MNKQFTDAGVLGGTNHTKLQAYRRLVRRYKVDILGIIEVSFLTGNGAVIALCALLNKFAGTDSYENRITTTRTHPLRPGEHNAIIYKTSKFTDRKMQIDKTVVPAVNNFPRRSTAKSQFFNRVPVLFTIKFSTPVKTLQLITWHCPAPSIIKPDNELQTLAECLMDLESNHISNQLPANLNNQKISIDIGELIMIAGDFNFSTDRGAIAAWQKYLPPSPPPLKKQRTANKVFRSGYIPGIVSLLSGELTTLVKKDPAVRVTKRFTPTKFDDVLCNAYDNILYHDARLKNLSIDYPVINHYKELVSKDGKRFVRVPGGFQVELNNANIISDHCMVVSTFQII